MVDGVHHHHLEQVLELAIEELHERLTQLGTGVARSGFESGDVVLGDAEPARQLTLSEVVLVSHRPKAGGADLYIHDDTQNNDVAVCLSMPLTARLW
jgi:hypothetical protein